jgi:hypothetical protein
VTIPKLMHTTLRDPRAHVMSLRMATAGPPRDRNDILRRRRALNADGPESVAIVAGSPPR